MRQSIVASAPTRRATSWASLGSGRTPKKCALKGFTVVGTFVDNDISATRGLPHPQYCELMGAVDRGELDVVVAWQTSRLWRNRRERAEGLERLSKAHVSVVTVKGQKLDLSTAQGRSFASILGEFDTMDEEVRSEPLVRQQRQAAEAGQRHGGGPRPFGYAYEYDRPRIDPDTGRKQSRRVIAVHLDDAEAEIIRECARRVLVGESLRRW